MFDILKDLPYEISYSAEFANRLYNYPPEVKAQRDKLFSELLQQGPHKTLKKIIAFSEKYPNTPQVRGFLATGYIIAGNDDKAAQVLEEVLNQFPDYIFSKLTKAEAEIDMGQLDEAREILGENLSILDIYPERKVFHVDEVASYEVAVIRYLLAMGNKPVADVRLETLSGIAPNSRYVLEANDIFADYMKDKLRPNLEEQLSHLQNQELRAIYKYDFTIPDQILSDILQLPRESLVQDLIWVLNNGKELSDFYMEEVEGDLMLHAIFILGELKAIESLPAVIEFLKWDDENLELWLGDNCTETLWRYFYQVAQGNPELLKEAMIAARMDSYAKCSIPMALCQMAMHQPELNERVAALFEFTFSYYLGLDEEEEEEVDNVFLSISLSELADLGLIGLVPSWEKLYEREFIDETICADLSQFRKELLATRSKRMYPILSIHEFYKDIVNTWASYQEDADDDMVNNEWDTTTNKPSSYWPGFSPPTQPVVRDAPKISRNEPCPCGSGRKYKVCCGKD